MPHSRPMPSIGARCHELRISDGPQTWRIFYRADADAVLIAAVEKKKTQKTPPSLIDLCRQRLKDYEQDQGESTG